MLLHHHIHEQLRHERQRDLLREGEARRARAAAARTAAAQPQPDPRRAHPLAATDRPTAAARPYGA